MLPVLSLVSEQTSFRHAFEHCARLYMYVTQQVLLSCCCCSCNSSAVGVGRHCCFNSGGHQNHVGTSLSQAGRMSCLLSKCSAAAAPPCSLLPQPSARSKLHDAFGSDSDSDSDGALAQRQAVSPYMTELKLWASAYRSCCAQQQVAQGLAAIHVAS